jgi:hypothetical protein
MMLNNLPNLLNTQYSPAESHTTQKEIDNLMNNIAII